MNAGKIEGRIKIDSDITIDAEDDGGTFQATLASGTYYLSSEGDGSNGIIDELQDELNANGLDTWTVSISAGESGDGKVTISADGATVAVTFNGSDAESIRDLLGFAGNLSGSTSYESTNHALGLWIPGTGVALQTLHAPTNFTGWTETAGVVTEGPTGVVHRLDLGSKTANELRWFGVPKRKTWTNDETTDGQSFESFWEDFIRGENTFARPGGPIRWYWDADDDTAHATYRFAELLNFRPEPLQENFTSHWIIDTGRIVLDPDTDVSLS